MEYSDTGDTTPVTFEVDGKGIEKFDATLLISCSSGAQNFTAYVKGPTKIDSKGKFTGSTKIPLGSGGHESATTVAYGVIGGRTASGFVQYVNPGICDSGSLHWKATPG